MNPKPIGKKKRRKERLPKPYVKSKEAIVEQMWNDGYAISEICARTGLTEGIVFRIRNSLGLKKREGRNISQRVANGRTSLGRIERGVKTSVLTALRRDLTTPATDPLTDTQILARLRAIREANEAANNPIQRTQKGPQQDEPVPE